ncbi:MAG: S8 family serine peptidase [Deltaproteobacteria bacterium]|nr:S8 family serine peptidase [Deltaproteobacteria bacterium]
MIETADVPGSARSLTFSGGLAEDKFVVLDQLGETAQVVAPVSSQRLLGALDRRQSVPLDPSDDFCERIILSGRAKSCSPNFELHATATPNDTHWDMLWGLSAETGIDAPTAWDINQGSEDVVVAVIDTGVDFTHPDLRANMWINHGEIPGNGIDDDNNGYIDDYHGASFSGSRDCMDDNGHGTHVAGTIGASGNNAIGVTGINWRVRIMAAKFLNADGSGSLANAINAINYVTKMKESGVNVRLSNNSWGGGGYSQALYNAIKRAHEAGVIFVAAAGNEGNNNDQSAAYPSSYDLPNVVSVAALGRNQRLADFSNYGASSVDLAAPGVSILSTFPGGVYQSLSGTSMAAPHVTGALAILSAAEPRLDNAALIGRLYDSGVPVNALQQKVRTGRKLNLGRMLKKQTVPVPVPPVIPEPCKYTAETVAFNPDYSADTARIVLQADELDYHRYMLPFLFPFHGKQISAIFISPNGVVYTQAAPNRMDFANDSRAPGNSIAALHTDLSATIDPYGVRVSASKSSVTIYWLAKVFGYEGHGDVEIRLSLFKTGTIETHISIPNTTLEQAVQRKATIGLAGQSDASVVTFAANDAAIRDKLAVRFSPTCNPNEGNLSVARLEAVGIGRNQKELGRAMPGRPLAIRLHGSGTGELSLKASLNNRKCPGVVPVSMFDGHASLDGVLPKVGRRYITVAFESSVGGRRTLRIQPNYKIMRRVKNAPKRLSPRTFERHCEALQASLVGGF